MVERDFCSFIDPASIETLREHFRLVFSEGARKRSEVLLQVKGGRPITILLESIPAKEAHGGPPQCRSAMTNISERKEAELAVAQQLGRLALLNQIARAIAERQELESMLRVVLRRLVEAFPVDATAILAYDRDNEMFTIHLQDSESTTLAAEIGLTEEARIPAEETGLQRCLTGETVYIPELAHWEGPLARKLSEHGIGSGVAAPMTTEGRIFGILVTLRHEAHAFSGGEIDFLRQLCERVALAMHQVHLYENLQETYDELRSTQQAMLQQERLRALGQMASGIAHDINNALSPVTLYSELMLMREPNLSEEGRHHLETIQRAAEDIAHTVARMREFCRPLEEQDIRLPVDLNAIVKEVVDLTRPRWSDIPHKTGMVIDIALELRQKLPLIQGVESELREALTNVILNAVDALPSGGTITLGTGTGRPDTASGEGSPTIDQVILRVSDTGIGMDEETKLHCLEPFFTRKGERGTGLGLSMVYGIMRRHGATNAIESELGKGTLFRFVFPAAEMLSAEAVPIKPTSYVGPPLRILCIDDDPLLRQGLKEALELDGHQVECADGGFAGLEAFREAQAHQKPFQIVITDLGMPQVDGREVAREVKHCSPGTPVILLTGWGSQLKTEGEQPSGVDRILSKPTKVTELWKALADLADIT